MCCKKYKKKFINFAIKLVVFTLLIMQEGLVQASAGSSQNSFQNLEMQSLDSHYLPASITSTSTDYIVLNTIIASHEKLSKENLKLSALSGLIGLNVFLDLNNLISGGFDFVKDVQLLKQDDELNASLAFRTLADGSQIFAYTASFLADGAYLLGGINYYNVQFQIPLMTYEKIQAAMFGFEMGGESSRVVSYLGDERGRQVASDTLISILRTSFSGLKLGFVVFNLDIPGGLVSLTAAQMALEYLLITTPKVYHYYFHSFVDTDRVSTLKKSLFTQRETTTYVQCQYQNETYWAQRIDESLDTKSWKYLGSKTPIWKRKMNYFSLNGVWITDTLTGHSYFATRNSPLQLMKACKLPLLAKEEKIKTGKKAELRELFKAFPDEGISFEARDYNYITRSFPILFFQDSKRNLLRQSRMSFVLEKGL